MTDQETFQKLWEAAGNCWHERRAVSWCNKCGHGFDNGDFPTLTLDVLFEIAEKLGYNQEIIFEKREEMILAGVSPIGKSYMTITGLLSDTPQLALLNALYQARESEEV